MSKRILHPEWRSVLAPVPYPFADDATLQNSAGDFLPFDVLLDLSLYLHGLAVGAYLSQVLIENDLATLTFGDSLTVSRASGSFNLLAPPEEIRLVDRYDRPAGVIVSEPLRLAVFQSWSPGLHEFTATQTPLVASCCVPISDVGVGGLLLDDGSLLSGDVWLVGDEGVVLECDTVIVPGDCQQAASEQKVVRVHIVGDPLFRRRLCAPGLFQTPRFLEQIVFQSGPKSHVCTPSETGSVKIGLGSQDNDQPILRVRPTTDGLLIETIGERLDRLPR